MAEGALNAAGTHIGVAITGVAGPAAERTRSRLGWSILLSPQHEETRVVKKSFDPNVVARPDPPWPR